MDQFPPPPRRFFIQFKVNRTIDLSALVSNFILVVSPLPNGSIRRCFDEERRGSRRSHHPGDLGQSLPPCGLEANVLSPGDLGESLAPWRLEDNVPTRCGLGLKFTVGTAVSVSPLGLLGGSSGSAGSTNQRGGGGRGDERGLLIFLFVYIRDILIKILTVVLPTFSTGSARDVK